MTGHDSLKKCVFLDRDGTVIKDKHYASDPDSVELLPGAAAGLRRLAGCGFALVLVSNQSGVGRGYFGEDAVRAMNTRLAEMLAEEGVSLAGMYYCPHAPEEKCSCRKPAAGMAERAVEDLGLDVAQSWVVGDKIDDMELGRNIGARTVLVRTGKGAEHEARCSACANFVADDLDQAALVIEAAD